MSLDNFFNPRSVAVIGASSDPKKVGFALVANLLKGTERKVYPVTLSEKQILGCPTFTSILEVAEPVDLAVIAVKAEIVPQVLADCGKKGIPNAIIISSGFGEVGESGKELERQIAEIAVENGISLLGPNCLGAIDAHNGMNATFAGHEPLKGKLAFLSQSGALGTAVLDMASSENIGFSKFVSLGNEAGLTESDFLDYLEADAETGAILMYLETIKDGPRFFETLKRVTAKKPVVVIKAGMGSHGHLAVKSHTGALAPEASVFVAACQQAGAVTVSSVRGFWNVLKILSQTGRGQPIQRLIVLTNGGGPSVVAADLIDRSRSLSLLALSEGLKWTLKEFLPPMAAVGNPIDLLGDALAERYDKVLEVLVREDEADAILVILTPQMMTEPAETARVLAKYKDKKRIFPIFIGAGAIEAGRQELIKSGLIHFSFPRDVIDALDYLAKGLPKPAPSIHHKTRAPKPEEPSVMMEFSEALELLSSYDISIAGAYLQKKEDLGNALQNFGAPYALKAISREAVHKTEANAVRLNIANFEEAAWVWEELWTQVPAVQGVLVQSMSGGAREVIIGMKRDKTFGPIIVFGLGGIYTEAIKDTVMRIAPIDKEEALKMLHKIKGVKILEGLRGQSPVNFDMLADIIVNLSRLAMEHPEIKEIDLNPVMATEFSATIVDARVMI